MIIEKPKIGFASDHAGYELKQKLIGYTKHEIGLNVNDYGTNNQKAVDYPDLCKKLIAGIELNAIDLGVLICGSGIGMSICANRNEFIRAALCHNEELARLAREHNDANVLVLGARFIALQNSKKVLKMFLTAQFQGGRHLRRIKKCRMLNKA